MVRLNNIFRVMIFCAAVFAISTVHAQTPTVTTTTSPTLVTPTPSITVTETPVVTETPTPTPTPTPKTEVIVTGASVGTQYPWNKRIPVKLTIKPSQSGSRLEVRWQKKAGLVASPTTRIILNPQAGATYTVSFNLTPYAPGFQRAVADIILSTNATNFVSSKDIPVQLDANKVVLPVTMTYIFYKIGMYLFIFLLFFVAVPYLIYRIYLYVKVNIYPKWLESKIQVPL